MSTGFSKQQWSLLTNEQQNALRKVYTSLHRRGFEQMTILREAAHNLKELDNYAMEQTNAILGGADVVELVFGVKNPLGLDEGTDVEEVFDKDGVKCIKSISFEDLLESTQERCDFLEQFVQGSGTFALPQEDSL